MLLLTVQQLLNITLDRVAAEVISHSQNADVDKRKVEAGRLP